MKRVIAAGAAIVLILVASAIYLAQAGPSQGMPRIIAPAEAPEGFSRAEKPISLEFPTDYGPHPDYQTEWWYYTGNLETREGRHFGYQLTFFRRALAPPDQREERESAWATDQLYFAHFAITDVSGGSHDEFERFARGAAGLAGAQPALYAVWLGNWRVEQIEPDIYHLRAEEQTLALDLTLTDQKGPVLQGIEGYSQKGPEPGNASYYYSQTRLETQGSVRIGDTVFEVEGLSWKDHEFSTSALGPEQVGWDWFALQLDDGSDLMVFQLRREDGTIDPFSSGTFITPDGRTYLLSQDDFSITVQDTWASPRTAGVYPTKWIIEVPAVDLALSLEPYLTDQELNVSFDYWEGAVQVEGIGEAGALMGWGYVELTGYAASMSGQF